MVQPTIAAEVLLTKTGSLLLLIVAFGIQKLITQYKALLINSIKQ